METFKVILTSASVDEILWRDNSNETSLAVCCSRWFLLLSLWMKSYSVTIQMKPLYQYFCMVLFLFKHFTKRNLGFVLNFEFRHPWDRVKGLKCS